MTIKVTKNGVSNNIVADMEFAKAVYPTSDGYSHELVIENPVINDAINQAEARNWRTQELDATDRIAQTPDWPDRDKYLTYRTKLRDWPSTSDFPDTKPTL